MSRYGKGKGTQRKARNKEIHTNLAIHLGFAAKCPVCSSELSYLESDVKEISYECGGFVFYDKMNKMCAACPSEKP